MEDRPLVEIYTWKHCPYCLRAKDLLKSKGVSFREYAIDGDEAAREAMARRAGGRRTVPQIFIDGRPVGGCTDLYELERRGQLDALLRPGAETAGGPAPVPPPEACREGPATRETAEALRLPAGAEGAGEAVGSAPS
jgi:glutaredoxin 3